MDIQTQITFYTNIIFFVLFVTSELLGYSTCEANSVTELITCPCGKRRIQVDMKENIVIATITPE